MKIKIYDRTPSKSSLSKFIDTSTFLKNSRLILKTRADNVGLIAATPVHIGNWKIKKLAPHKWEVRYTKNRKDEINPDDLLDLGILAYNLDEVYLDTKLIEYSFAAIILLIIAAFIIGYLTGKG